MSDPKARPRRLRKVAEILKELQNLSSSESELRSNSEKSDPRKSSVSSASNSSEDSKSFIVSSDSEKGKKRKQKEKKAKVPKLKTFNKLLNLNTLNEDYSVEEFEFLRDQPLEFDSFKPCKKSLDQKVFKDESNKTSYSLAKSVLTNQDERDSFVVNNPVKVAGFISKNLSQNSREVFREGLKNKINSRKTNHIDNEGIFNKPSTDFSKKDEKQFIIINDHSFNSVLSAKSSEKSEEMMKKNDFSQSTPAGSTRNSSPVFTKKDPEANQCKAKTSQSETIENPAMKGKRVENFSTLQPKSSAKPKNMHLIDLEAEKSGSDHSSDTLEDNCEDFLSEMIDDSEVSKDENYAKHMQDLLAKEEKEIRMVVNAEFKRKKSEKIELVTRVIKKTQSRPEPAKAKVFSRAEEDFDEDSKLLALKQFRGIKHFRLQEKKTPIFDEKSNDYLKLFERPETLRASRSFLNKPASEFNEKTIKKPAKAFFILKK